MAKKLVLILLDGLGDKGISEFGGKTPLIAANTPAMDAIARKGACGLFHAGLLGVPYPSENAHFSMFNYTLDEFPGRGPLEALGAGVPLETGDVAVLGRLECCELDEKGLKLTQTRPEYREKEAVALLESVKSFKYDGLELEFHHYSGLHGIIKIKNASREVSDSNPMNRGYHITRCFALELAGDMEKARKTAALLNAYMGWCHERLQNHPVNSERAAKGLPPLNAVVFQRAGSMREVPDFRQRNGFKAASISSGFLYPGIGKFLGMDILTPPRDEDPGSDLAARLSMAKKALDDYDFIHVHTKYPDQAAHKKDPMLKRDVIESLDAAIASECGELLKDPSVVTVLTSDHSTPSAGEMIHSGEPVPIAFAGSGVRRDAIQVFDECACAMGCLGTVRGPEFMRLALNFTDRAKLFGTSDSAGDQPFWPGDHVPFHPGRK